MRGLVLSMTTLGLTVAAVSTAHAVESDLGPSWSQLAGWLGATLATIIGAWAARLEWRLAQEAQQRADDLGALAVRLETHIGRADARAADMMQKAASNTLALSDLRLEMARALNNHPTKSDFDRGLDRLGERVEALADKFDLFLAGQRK